MVVPKKQDPDNPCEVQLRMVIDYRQLNKRIITSRAPDRNGKVGKVILNYPMLTIESLLARLEGCKYFFHLGFKKWLSSYRILQAVKAFNCIHNALREISMECFTFWHRNWSSNFQFCHK